MRTTSAEPVTISSSSTYSRVTPYFRQHSPPALVATLPPIVDHGALAGSGGYHRPCSATAALRSSLTTPGSTTATRSSASISSTRSIRDRSSSRQPSTALAPPDRPVPAPRVTTGTPSSAQAATICCTSAVLRARTAASARPTSAHAASSELTLRRTSSSVIRALPGSRRVSASSVPGEVVVTVPTLEPHHDRPQHDHREEHDGERQVDRHPADPQRRDDPADRGDQRLGEPVGDRAGTDQTRAGARRQDADPVEDDAGQQDEHDQQQDRAEQGSDGTHGVVLPSGVQGRRRVCATDGSGLWTPGAPSEGVGRSAGAPPAGVAHPASARAAAP